MRYTSPQYTHVIHILHIRYTAITYQPCTCVPHRLGTLISHTTYVLPIRYASIKNPKYAFATRPSHTCYTSIGRNMFYTMHPLGIPATLSRLTPSIHSLVSRSTYVRQPLHILYTLGAHT